MKRLVAVCVLMLTLSFPTFGGHTVVGNAYCTCGTPGCLEDYPGECGKTLSASTSASTEAPDSGTAEWGIVLVGLLLWLRLKA